MKKIYDRIIERLREKAEAFLTDAYKECSDFEIQYFMSLTMDDVEKTIYEIASEYNDGWIPTSKRLPEEPDLKAESSEQGLQEYIVMIRDAEKSTTLYYAGDGEWCHDGIYYSVTAWQPLPEWNANSDKYKWDSGKRLNGITKKMLADKEQKA